MGAKWLLLISFFCLFLTSGTYAYDPQLPALADSLRSLSLDFTRQARVSNLTIQRGGIEIVLEDGLLLLSHPVAGRVLAAGFMGQGRFIMTPPNPAETYMFQRHCSDSSANWEFKEITLIFTDSTAGEFASRLAFDADPSIKSEQRQLAAFINHLEDDFDMSFPALLLRDLFQPQRPGRFFARVNTPCGHCVFMYAPGDVEEIQLYKHVTSAAYPDIISSFHSADQYAAGAWGPDREDKDLIDSLDYSIDCKIWQSARCDLKVDLSFTSKVEDLRVVDFSIFLDLMHETIRITDSRGDSLNWLKLDDESAVTVVLTRPLALGERESLHFEYSSKGMLRKTPWGNNVLVSSTTWYPRYGYLKRARHRLKFAVPQQYEFVGVGKKLNETVVDDFKVTEWDISDYPVSMVSYNYGVFDVDTASILTAEGRRPLTVYRSKSHRASTKDMMEDVMRDIADATALYSVEVRSYPFESLAVTEIQSGHGQGLPGLLHLAYSTFDRNTINAFDDAFRAHEVAHQWWGHLVGWKTYHDQWLSEAFAEYFSGWYIQRKYLNDKEHRGRFFELLDQWRDDVFQSGSITESGWSTDYQEGNDAGPIWMGYRLQSSRSADYSTLVYSKGAYVLYMLRMMMFDFVKRDDSKFRTMLADFLNEYQWSEATTADFQRVAEKHYGAPLDWFFRQWVYGTDLPEYEWRASVRQQEDGKYTVEVGVTTKNAADDFRMPISFTILMEGEYHTTTRLDINHPRQTVTIPNLPHKPEKFVFNSFKSVLCKEHQK